MFNKSNNIRTFNITTVHDNIITLFELVFIEFIEYYVLECTTFSGLYVTA